MLLKCFAARVSRSERCLCSMGNPRKTALNVLLKIVNDGAYSNIALSGELSNTDLSAQDKALATAIIYGVLDRNITLEYILKAYIKTPLKKVQPVTLMALKCALYQIMYMDKIPESAAVNEAVKIVKSSRERHNAAFLNAVLRNILRSNITLPDGDSVEELSVKYSCPVWIIEGFVSDYGIENTIALLSASLEVPRVTLRTNTLKCTADELVLALKSEGVRAHTSELSGAVSIDGNINISDNNCYKKGMFHVQDIASQTVAGILGAKQGERVLDMCASPGGKTFTVAQNMENAGEIVSCDLYEQRVGLIEKGARRLGLDIVKPTVCDATAFNSDLGLFDRILCDVPCSGLGVIRRKPEIKYKPQNDFKELTEIQSAILNNAAKYLKTGGRILYSTCTLRNAENGAVVHAFLDKYKEYELEYEHTYMPHTDGTDGFYCALIQKSR